MSTTDNCTELLEVDPEHRATLRHAFGEGRRLNGASGESHGILNFNRVTKVPAPLPPIVVTVPAGCPEILGAEPRRPSDGPKPSMTTSIVSVADVQIANNEPIEQGDDIEICPDCGRVIVRHVRHECICEEAAANAA